ncbi:MAG: hypothetical protein WD229_14160 [Pirellulales bacterium]
MALSILQQALDYATDIGREPCEFAVSMQDLWHPGVTTADVRWLVEQGYASARDTHQSPKGSRIERPMDRLPYTAGTWFILSAKGAKFFRQVAGPTISPSLLTAPSLMPHHDRLAGPEDQPHWDAMLRQLSLGPILVKRFRVPAPCQELILVAFQAADWACWIKNPLPPDTYLRGTIHRLNLGHVHAALHFEADGRALGVYWTRTH